MKYTYIYKGLLAAALALAVSGCVKDQDDYFSHSAAERVEIAQENARKALLSSANGWVMQYFCDSTQAGHIMVVKFNADKSVTVAAKNVATGNVYKTESSCYDILAENGPELTFNSYNTIFHTFSDPQSDGTGYGGDYEFIIIEASESFVRMKGVKHDAYINMYPLDLDTDWNEYLSSFENVKSAIFAADDVTLICKVGDEKVELASGLTGVFSTEATPTGDLPYILTENGLRFYRPLTIGGVSVENFVFSEDKTSLVCQENPAAVITGPELTSYFAESTSSWTIVADDMSSSIKTVYDALSEAFHTRYSTRYVENLGFSTKTFADGSASVTTAALLIQATKTACNYALTITEADGKIVIAAYQPENATTDYLFDSNGKKIYNEVAGVDAMIKAICGTYSVSSASPLNISEITFVNDNDSSKSFTVKRASSSSSIL